jgi:hypothetical protein
MIVPMDNVIAFLFIFFVVIPALYALAVLIAAAMVVILALLPVAFVAVVCYTRFSRRV